MTSAPDFLHFLRTADGRALAARFETRRLTRATLLCTPNDRCDQVFVVLSGRLRVYLADDDRELTLAFLDAGDVYATHTPTFVRTVTACSLLVLDTPRFAELLQRQPLLTPAIMRVLGRLLGNSVAIIDSLAFRDVRTRLAQWLANHVCRHGRRVDGALVAALTLSFVELAQLLGTTRQSVSAGIGELERAGLIARQGRRTLRVPDLDALRRWPATDEKSA